MWWNQPKIQNAANQQNNLRSGAKCVFAGNEENKALSKRNENGMYCVCT